MIINGGVVVGLAIFAVGMFACLIAGTCIAVGSRSDEGARD